MLIETVLQGQSVSKDHGLPDVEYYKLTAFLLLTAINSDPDDCLMANTYIPAQPSLYCGYTWYRFST